jgi:hypothetical protein
MKPCGLKRQDIWEALALVEGRPEERKQQWPNAIARHPEVTSHRNNTTTCLLSYTCDTATMEILLKSAYDRALSCWNIGERDL